MTLEPDLFLVGQCHPDHPFLAPTQQTSRLRCCSSGRLPGGGVLPGAAVFSLLGHPAPSFPTSDRWVRPGRLGLGAGVEGLHSRPLQELLLLLLPIGVHQLLGHQLHQLQALLDLHQDLKVLPAPHLSTDKRTLCLPRTCRQRLATDPSPHLLAQGSASPFSGLSSPYSQGGSPGPALLSRSRSERSWWAGSCPCKPHPLLTTSASLPHSLLPLFRAQQT